MINVLILVLKLVAILHVASTLAIICGIAVLLRAQNPGMEAKVGLIFSWAGTGAALTIELAVRMLHGQAMMLKRLTASMLISLGLCILLKITMQWVNTSHLKQLGGMYVGSAGQHWPDC